MKLAAVVCEYNPFHSGHLYHIEKTKAETGCDGVIAVMSGNFVQRGEAAIFSKEERAQAAVNSGADLVLELSPFFALQTAEIFAANALKIITSIPEVCYLSFGIEDNSRKGIERTAQIFSKEAEAFSHLLKQKLGEGVSFPAARHAALEEMGENEAAEILKKPNAILAVEYLKALKKFGSAIEPVYITRKGAAHDSSAETDGFFSASRLREIICGENPERIYLSVPREAFEVYKNAKPFKSAAFEKAVIANLLKMPAEELAKITDVSEGLENRIKACAESAQSLKELADAIKTKRYTHSRIRRILLSSYLGIYDSEKYITPPYAKILGFNKNGRKILNRIKKTSKIPIVKNMKAVKALKDPEIIRLYEREIQADKIYGLFEGENR